MDTFCKYWISAYQETIKLQLRSCILTCSSDEANEEMLSRFEWRINRTELGSVKWVPRGSNLMVHYPRHQNRSSNTALTFLRHLITGGLAGLCKLPSKGIRPLPGSRGGRRCHLWNEMQTLVSSVPFGCWRVGFSLCPTCIFCGTGITSPTLSGLSCPLTLP